MSRWLALPLDAQTFLHRKKASGPGVPTIAVASHGIVAGMFRR